MAAPTAKKWFSRLAPYRSSDDARAFFEIMVTLFPFLALWLGMWMLLQGGHYWALIGVIPAGGLIVRLFIIQHDCGHRSMFSKKKAKSYVKVCFHFVLSNRHFHNHAFKTRMFTDCFQKHYFNIVSKCVHVCCICVLQQYLYF